MVLIDVNVLVGAMRTDAPRHQVMRATIDALMAAPEPFGLCDVVLTGTLRVLSHPRIFTPPTPLPIAQDFVRVLRASPNAVLVAPGPRHWELFATLVRDVNATGNLISDAYLAALAIEHGCEVLSDDADFARFPGLRWRRP